MSQAETGSGLRHHLARHAYDRLLLLSDGVFAIALTLAALEIRPPHGSTAAGATAVELMQAMAGPLLAYAISFLVIGAFWLAHRRMLALFERVDPGAAMLNLLVLGLVALQPAGVGLLMSGALGEGALKVYLGLTALTGFAQAALWGYAAFVARLLRPEVGKAYRWMQFVVTLGLPALASGLALFATRTGSGWLVLGVFVFLIVLAVARHRISRRLGV